MTFVFLLLCCSTVKGKNAEQNISKKDTAAQKIMSHLLSSSLFEKNDGQYDDPFEYRFTNGNACVDFYKNQVLILNNFENRHQPILEKQTLFPSNVCPIQSDFSIYE